MGKENYGKAGEPQTFKELKGEDRELFHELMLILLKRYPYFKLELEYPRVHLSLRLPNGRYFNDESQFNDLDDFEDMFAYLQEGALLLGA